MNSALLKLKNCFLSCRISWSINILQILPSLCCWYKDKECNVSVMDENRQEWMITLWFGQQWENNQRGKAQYRQKTYHLIKVINNHLAIGEFISLCLLQNMLSLMQTICEVVEASVKQLVLSNGTTLRVKLSVTPLTSRKGNRKGEEQTYHIKQTNGPISYLINLQKSSWSNTVLITFDFCPSWERDAGMSLNERDQIEDSVRCAESPHSQIRWF